MGCAVVVSGQRRFSGDLLGRDTRRCALEPRGISSERLISPEARREPGGGYARACVGLALAARDRRLSGLHYQDWRCLFARLGRAVVCRRLSFADRDARRIAPVAALTASARLQSSPHLYRRCRRAWARSCAARASGFMDRLEPARIL